MGLVTVLVWVVHKRTVSRWVLAVLVFRRIRVAAVVAIGVVGRRATLHSLIAQVLAAIPVVAVVQATPQQKWRCQFTRRVTKQVQGRFPCRTPSIQPRQW